TGKPDLRRGRALPALCRSSANPGGRCTGAVPLSATQVGCLGRAAGGAVGKYANSLERGPRRSLAGLAGAAARKGGRSRLPDPARQVWMFLRRPDQAGFLFVVR